MFNDLGGWVALATVSIACVGFFFKLEWRCDRLDEKIIELAEKRKEDLEDSKVRLAKFEITFESSIEHLAKALEQSNKNYQDLTIQVAKMMAQLEHKYQRVSDAQLKDLKDFLDK